jgi:DNA invertase Pin-like site-specific DNA recombinase
MESTAIYIRAGSADQSTTNQRQRTLEYATDILGLDREDVFVLTDEGTETRQDQSSGYQRLISLIEAAEIRRIIVADASRIAKNIKDLYQMVVRCSENGVALHVIEAGLRIGERGERAIEPDDATMLRALEIAADLGSTVNAERTREGIEAAKASGKHVGRPPFGFDSENGQLTANDDFDTALLVIERIENGESKRSTARVANITRTTVQNIVDRSDLYRNHAEAAAETD